jgi:hypothetical protein
MMAFPTAVYHEKPHVSILSWAMDYEQESASLSPENPIVPQGVV